MMGSNRVYCPLCGAFCGEHFLCESCRAEIRRQAASKAEERRLKCKAELNRIRESGDMAALRDFFSVPPWKHR
jgi:hypothetical protein